MKSIHEIFVKLFSRKILLHATQFHKKILFRLRAMEQPTKLIKTSNLELKRQSGSTARLRASSPIVEQNAPLV